MSLKQAINLGDPETLEFTPEDYFTPVRVEDLFAQTAPLQVDVGCGEGAFIVAMAKANPGTNFLGVERLVGRVRKVCKRAVNAKVENVRVMCVEISYTVQHLLPKGSVSVLHVMFPDPWPKRKHRKNRLVNHEFLDAIHAALQSDGELRLTTDDLDYFEWMQKVAAGHKGFAAAPWPDDPMYPMTDFEKRFRAQGLPIHRLLLRKLNS
ncbi:MAG: tRNA (guanosine(46)-N7)-methyltransferase TrmB [Chthoniobacteraceae bacterium]